MTWSATRYFAKAGLYWTRATSLEREQPEFLLYVSFTLELLVRGALCSIHPSLNAAPDVESLLYANGLVPRTPPRTVSLHDAMARLKRFISEVTQAEAEAIEVLIQTRNSELHDDGDALEQLNADTVMPHVYSLFTKIATKSSVELSDILGTEDAAHAGKVAQAIASDRKKRVTELIRIHRDRFYGLKEDEQARLRREGEPILELPLIRNNQYAGKRLCPACKAQGLVIGAPVGRSEPILKEDGIIQEIRVSPTQFTCKACELNVKGLDELIAAGFPHEVKVVAYVDPVEHLSIDPMEYIDVHKVIADYFRDEGQYLDE